MPKIWAHLLTPCLHFQDFFVMMNTQTNSSKRHNGWPNRATSLKYIFQEALGRWSVPSMSLTNHLRNSVDLRRFAAKPNPDVRVIGEAPGCLRAKRGCITAITATSAVIIIKRHKLRVTEFLLLAVRSRWRGECFIPVPRYFFSGWRQRINESKLGLSMSGNWCLWIIQSGISSVQWGLLCLLASVCLCGGNFTGDYMAANSDHFQRGLKILTTFGEDLTQLWWITNQMKLPVFSLRIWWAAVKDSSKKCCTAFLQVPSFLLTVNHTWLLYVPCHFFQYSDNESKWFRAVLVQQLDMCTVIKPKCHRLLSFVLGVS